MEGPQTLVIAACMIIIALAPASAGFDASTPAPAGCGLGTEPTCPPASSSGAEPWLEEDRDCRDHPPIRIENDTGPQGFILGHAPASDQPIYRPGSGVTDGSGTAADPYVIEGWCIVPDPGSGTLLDGIAISIENTSAHVVVQDNLVDGQITEDLDPLEIGDAKVEGRNQAVGIRLEGVENVALEENRIVRNHIGLDATGSDELGITENEIEDNGHGMRLQDVEAAAASANTLTHNEVAIRAESAPGASLEGNMLQDNDLGIQIDSSAQVRIVGNTIDRNDRGAHLLDADDARISGNTIHRNYWSGGVLVERSADPSIVDNTVVDNQEGIRVLASDGPVVQANTIEENFLGGLILESSTDAQMRANTFTFDGVEIRGERLSHYEHDVDASNTVNGDPIRYIRDQVEPTVAAPVGQAILVDTQRPLVSELRIEETTVAITVAFSDEPTVSGNELIENDRYDVLVHASPEAMVSDNSVSNHLPLEHNLDDAILVSDSPDAVLRGNTVEDKGDGIAVVRSDDSTVNDNTILNSGWALQLEHSNRTTIKDNTLRDNLQGIRADPAHGIDVTDNMLDANFDGIVIWGSQDARIEHNAVEDNKDIGVGLLGSTAGTAVRNVIQGNHIGVWVGGPTEGAVVSNDIVGNDEVGLVVRSVDHTTDARDNWWGAPSGPSGTAHDACTFAEADGDGDRIETRGIGTPEVCFEPWREAPVPSSGPRS